MKYFLLTILSSAIVLSGCEKKPDSNVSIDHTCVMNGHGTGWCTFTNSHDEGTGKMCGKIKVINLEGKYVGSEVFCSGEVGPSTSKKIDFSVPAVGELCSHHTLPWTEMCQFGFEKN